MSSNSQPAPDQDNDSVPLLKKYIVHTAFLSLIIGVAWQGRTSAVTDRNSLLYSVIAGEEVVEGPLDPLPRRPSAAPSRRPRPHARGQVRALADHLRRSRGNIC